MGFLEGPNQRWFLYGYNVDEVEIGPGPVTAPDHGSVSGVLSSNGEKRMPEMVALPCVITGAVYYRPNVGDPLSAVRGLQKRLVHDRPPIEEGLLRRFKNFVAVWLRENLSPLSSADVPSFEEWLAQVNHPDWRKKEYQKAHDQWYEGTVPMSKLRVKKCFVKREFYDTGKYHRIIHSPTDYEKVLQGRFISAIEKVLFARPEFIKKIPRSEWPTYIRDRVGVDGFRKFASDYSSFEANFVEELQESCELALARYMLSNFIGDAAVDDILHGDSLKFLESKLFRAHIRGTRSSGKMSTSLFNGFSNEMFNLFFLKEVCGATDVRCVIEGDDGLFAHNGKIDPTPEMYLRLGLTIKIEVVDQWYEASFCGVVTHPDVMRTLASPWKVICTASWASSDYLRASPQTLRMLAHIKALSYLAQYPGCPVIQSIAMWMLRTTGFERESLDYLLVWYEQQRSTSWWDRTLVEDIRRSSLECVPVETGSRVVMEKVFGMSVQTQQTLESIFDNDTTGRVDVVDYVPSKYVIQWNYYVRWRDKFDKELNIPYHMPPRVYDQQLFPFERSRFETPDFFHREMLAVKLSKNPLEFVRPI